jgi:hypothetical protein
VVDLPQLGRRGDRKRAEKMRDIAPVGVAGAVALLFLQPDFFLGDGGERCHGRGQAIGRAADRQVGWWGDGRGSGGHGGLVGESIRA